MNTPLLTVWILILAWLALAWITLVRPARQRRKALQANSIAASADDIAVIHASQGGTAAELAERTAQALGDRARVYALAELGPQDLARMSTALFIVSTYGEGDPPDSAQAFQRRALAWAADQQLQGLKFGLLALGDRSYQQFCGYGRQVEAWLRQHGAAPMFDSILVDRLNDKALQKWQSRLETHLQAGSWQAVAPTAWRLVQRHWLNPGSQGAPCHELVLECQDAEAPPWQAGDIAQITIGNTGQQRDYSIASTPAEKQLRLLVRLQYRADDSPGLGSHWLSETLQIGDIVHLHIRRNAQFHRVDDDRPAIFIGNGTGLAGLRSLLQERHEHGHRENWLLFGERQRATDFHWQRVLEQWLGDNTLNRLDLAFSRDQAEKRYVHHALRDAMPYLKDWIARGAVLYVCGSREGMAQDVDQALQDILGPHGYQDLQARGGYRRDVY